MANFLGLQNRVGSRARMDMTQAAISTVVQQYINETQKEIWEASDWYFAIDRQVVQTNPDVSAGTVSVSVGSAVVTGSGTAFTASMVGYFIQLATTTDWYQILSVQNATQLTMEANFVSSTALSAGKYTIRQMFYSLSSTADKILTARQTVSPAYLDVMSYRDFDIFRPYPLSIGDPQIMVVYGVDSSGNLRFTPYPWPSVVENLEIRYKKKPVDMAANTDTSLIPDKWNETVLVQGAYAKCCQYQDDGSQPALHARYISAVQKFQAMLQTMIATEKPDASYHPIIKNRDAANVSVGPILPYKYGGD